MSLSLGSIKLSIPLSEIQKLTNNPEWQKNIQIINQTLINAQTGLIAFFKKPEVQQTLIGIQNASIALNKYLNDPVVQKNLQNFQKLVVEIVNSQNFQKNYINNQKIANTENFTFFEESIRDEINVSEQLQSFETEEEKSRFLNFFLQFIFIIFTFHINNLETTSDFKETYIYYVNNIESKGITISRIHLREAPSFQSESIIVIPRNTPLKVYKEVTNRWVKVSVNINNIDLEGYVSEVYIKRVKNKYDFNSSLAVDDK
ncbi:SH3 domain-containing protein [Acinetobacter cumulans]|uniref:SH3 domain-containing protein n=1 Tax=Acinetobacter cumulans TaxID=2136182 RepID=A0A498CV05_9GAMM|nr:SH3 domain-containing protein [Acinetobacter cumulans]